MSYFDRPMVGFRYADTFRGDTLQRIAARELGDASRWTDLISFNKLVSPFVTDDPSEASATVLLTGQPILVPAPSPVVTSAANPEAVFERDVKLDAGGLLSVGADGDFAVASGRENLKQAISMRVRTELGELLLHLGYGCDVRRLIGKVNGPTKRLIGARTVSTAVELDPRVSRVTRAVATVAGDVMSVEVVAETVAGRSLQLNEQVQV